MSAQQSEHSGPHHPLYCHEIERLKYHNDGSLTCPHSKAPPGPGLQSALDYSVALLIVELAGAGKYESSKKPQAKPKPE